MTWQKYTRDILLSHLSLWRQFQHMTSVTKCTCTTALLQIPAACFPGPFMLFCFRTTATIRGWPSTRNLLRAAVTLFLIQQCTHTHTHTHPFNGPFSGTTQVSHYQKGKTNLDFDSEWQWHQLGHMQVCTLPQTDNHSSTPPLCFLQAGCPSCRPTNSVKALKGIQQCSLE